MNAERLFGNKDFQLLERAKEVSFQLGKETRAALTAEVQNGQDDDTVKVDTILIVPDTAQRRVPLLGSQVAELSHEASLDGIEKLPGKGPALVIGQGQIKIVTASRSSHVLALPAVHRVERPAQKAAFCGAACAAVGR
jgi:hypothetical protein